jgi:hypothetical protein
MWKAAAHYFGMARKLPRWARMPLEPDPPAVVRRMLENRDSNFLDLMRSAVFGNPTSPYRQLFTWAGCTFGDLEHTVRKDGLEPALRSLRDAGVYLSHDEFKGLCPVVRGSQQMMVDSADLANPDPRFQRATPEGSSGSRSRGTTTWRSLEYHTYREALECVLYADHRAGREDVRVEEVLPNTGGIRNALHHGLRHGRPRRWFAMSGDAHYHAMTRLMLLELRALGVPLRWPDILPHNDFSPVARYIAERKRAGAALLVTGTASKLVRIAAAAIESGLDISGTRFISGGEALTDAKRAVIETAGVEVHARYVTSELGVIGVGCRQMEGNCVHLAMDSLAAITRRRVPPLSDVEVDSLMFTTVLPFAATIGVNLEMDDAGTLGPASCECPLAHLGMTQQIDDIFSYGKLTGYGTSLMGGEVLSLLEESLPAKFGGVPSDYQLVEREGSHQTELELRIHPRLQLASADAVRAYFLDEIRTLWGGSLTRRFWTRSESVRAVIAEPYMVRRGKVHALHLLGGRQNRAGRAAT